MGRKWLWPAVGFGVFFVGGWLACVALADYPSPIGPTQPKQPEAPSLTSREENQPLRQSATSSSGDDLSIGIFVTVLAAVVGLVSAGVQGLVGYLFQRGVSRSDALVRAQYQLVTVLDTVAMNRGRLEKVLKEMSSGVLVAAWPSHFVIGEVRHSEIFDQILTNEILVLDMHLFRFNRALEAWREAYEKLRDGRIGGTVDAGTFDKNAKGMLVLPPQLTRHLDLIEGRARKCVARVRLHARRPNMAAFLRHWVPPTREVTALDVEKEVAAMVEDARAKNQALKEELEKAISGS